MGYARHISRVGALAVALGIGAGQAATPWMAAAKPSHSGSSHSPSHSSSSSKSSPTDPPLSTAATSSTAATGSSTPDPTSAAGPHTGIVHISGPTLHRVRVNDKSDATGGDTAATTTVDKPIRGIGQGTIRINTATGALTGEESGVISHLGRNTVHLKGVSTLSPDGGVSSSGTVTIVAANGDRLTGTFTLNGHEPTLTAVVTITGGTGRFANATGTLTVDCVTLGAPAQKKQTLVIKHDCTIKGGISY